MAPINDFIFRNPDAASIPMMVVLGAVFLSLFVLSIFYGTRGAREIVGRFRWVYVIAIAAAALWGLYAYAVLQPPSLWG